jgi:hypothetical protein
MRKNIAQEARMLRAITRWLGLKGLDVKSLGVRTLGVRTQAERAESRITEVVPGDVL